VSALMDLSNNKIGDSTGDSFCVSATTSLKNETEVSRIFFASLRKPH
jgi:hypothetical protein